MISGSGMSEKKKKIFVTFFLMLRYTNTNNEIRKYNG